MTDDATKRTSIEAQTGRASRSRSGRQPRASRRRRSSRAEERQPLKAPPWTVEQKARLLADAAALGAEALCQYLDQRGVSFLDYELWRRALQNDTQSSIDTAQRVRALKRALARTQRAMAAATAVLVKEHHQRGIEYLAGSLPRMRRRMRAAPDKPMWHPRSRAVDGPVGGEIASVDARSRRRAKLVGRPRKYNPSIPAHIDQATLPQGLYWDGSGAGRWYVVVPDPSGGAPRRKNVAGKNARLSVLRAIVRQPQGAYVRGTVGWVMTRFEESTDFAELSPATRECYGYAKRTAQAYRTHHGRGPSLDQLYVDRLRVPVIQRAIETIGKGRKETLPGAGDALPAFPTKANHLLRYLNRVFGWGIRHGHCKTNPAAAAQEVRERARSGMPTRITYDAVLKFAQARGALKPSARGRLAPYLGPLMEIKYLCRMRSIEVRALTDAHASEQGVYIARRKRSLDTIVRWSPRLRAAWDAAVGLRASIWARPGNKARPMPPPERRLLFVTRTATPLSKSALNSAWKKLLRAAVEAEVITKEQSFTLHGLKHRGVTDTKGSRRRKQRASGHLSESMVALYDHDVPVVAPATPAESLRADVLVGSGRVLAPAMARSPVDGGGTPADPSPG